MDQENQTQIVDVEESSDVSQTSSNTQNTGSWSFEGALSFVRELLSSKGLSSKRILIAGCALVVLVVAGIVKSLGAFKEEVDQLAAFKPHVASYLSVAEERPEGDEAYVRGKLVIVDEKSKELHQWAHGQLAAEIRANTPDDVGTVAVTWTTWQRVGEYVNKATGKKLEGAYQGYLHVALVDWKSGSVITKKTFKGSEPSQQITDSMSGHGGLPWWDALRWLKALPRR